MKLDLSRAVCYYRVSTQKQADEYSSLKAYQQRFIQFGFSNLDRHYYDIASGGKRNREGYQAILQLVKNGDVDKVYIPEISRLSRDIGHFQEALEAFQQSGAELITLDGHEFDLNTPTGSLNVNLQVLFAENTRRTNQYRALKGHEFLREEGRAVRPVFPYVKPDDKLLPNTSKYKSTNKTTWDIGRELVETFITEQNLSKTIKIMVAKYGDKSGHFWEDFARDHSGFRDWLVSQTIRGNLEYFGGRRYKRKKNAPEPIIVYNTHEPLITEEEYHQINTILTIGKKSRSKVNKLRNLWVGKLFCECGSPMKISTSKGGSGNIFHYVVCKSAYPNSSNVKAKQALGLIAQCDRRSSYGLTLEKLEDIVIDELCNRALVIANTYYPEEQEQSLPPEVLDLNKQIKTYQLLSEEDPDLLPLLEKKIKRRDYLLGKQEAEGTLYSANLRNNIISFGQDKEFWLTTSPAERKLLYQDLVDKIICVKGQVKISFLV